MNTNKIIYVIDDDKIYQFTMKKLLKMLGFENQVKFFLDGEHAIQSINLALDSKESLPDILFLDINMPIMDGFEFLDEFLKIKTKFDKKIAIHIVSSSVDQIDIERIKINKDVISYITKPISLIIIQNILKDI